MTETVQQAYDALLARGEIARDPAQEAVLPLLDSLRAQAHRAAAGRGGLRRLLARGRRRHDRRGLYLWGGVGRGKSMLMDLFVATLQVPARRVHFHAFMQEIHAGMNAARRQGVTDALRPVADAVATGARVLAFDEMQISDITDAMVVGRLFELLFETGVLIVTTSNRPPDDLYKDGLNRGLFLPFIELLKERMLVHELAAKTDYRQGRMVGADRYFTPADQRARAAIDRLWQGLTGGREHPLVLNVQGREVALRRFHNGVARAAFRELCGQPLGAADYLALAEAVRVLILEDVPLMGRENHNEARRFVTLIDALYEAKVRLVVSAAAEPERLYAEGSGSFEFERTASRLREMQSAEWGASTA